MRPWLLAQAEEQDSSLPSCLKQVEHWTKIQHNGKSWTQSQVEAYRTSNNLTWHEMSNMQSMQLVPRQVNLTFTHFGGVAEYNAMIGQEGVTEFD